MSKTIVGKPGNSGKAFRLAAILLGSTALFGLTLTGAARADETWTGVTSTDWFTAGNWNGNAVPTNTDSVVIDTITTHPTVIDNNNAVAHDMTVGDVGTGALTIQNAGTLHLGANVTLGNHANSIGTITVDASDLNAANGFVFVGESGAGNFTVQNSGSLEANVVILSDKAGSSGNLTITGTGSSMTLSDGVAVGEDGVGFFSLLHGATANVVDIDIGDDVGTGTVVIDGAGTLLTSTSQLTIGGESGGSGTFTVSNSGEVENGRTIIGDAPGSTGTITVTDADSFFTSNLDLEVGSAGNGTLNIQSGGTVFAVGQTIVGEQTGGMGTISIDGIDSSLNATTSIFVGGDGTDPTGGNGTITVTNGGSIQDFGSLFLGNPAGSTGNVTISGADSLANVVGSVRVGADGTGTLTISGGGALNAASLIAGWDTGSSGSINVTDTGSTLLVSGDLAVAESGDASMSVLAGGNVSDTTASIGSDTGNGTVTVDGTGSIWKTTNTLNIGQNGNAVLTISGGGVVDASSANIAGDAGVSGAVTVTGADSAWNAATVTVGQFGAGSMTIQNGGVVSDTTGVVALNPAATGSVAIDGAGSAWNNVGAFVVGALGQGTLAVTNGGHITDVDGIVGFETGSIGTATLDGMGSRWDSSATFAAGLGGNGTLTVSNGAVLNDGNGFLGLETGAVGAVTVTGAGSSWVSATDMVVGGTTLTPVTNGGTGTLMVQNGGSVSDATGYIGNTVGAVGIATVDGAGSSWTTVGALHVGGDDATGMGTGTLLVSHGGAVSAGDIDIGASAGSNGTATVDGANSSITVTDDIFVGQSGSGALHISNGGTVTDPGGTIASNSGSSGIATVDGAGSAWINTSEIVVGDEGTGVLTVSNGGTVSATNALYVTNTGTGTLNIGADASSAAAAPGTIDTPLVSFNGGTGAIIFNHTSTNYTFAPVISGSGILNAVAGTTILSADGSAFTGSAEVNGGTLLVNGKLGGSGVDALSGTLGGKGSIVGATIIESGAALQGVQGQTLAMGSLKLESGANVNISLTDASSPAMFDVAGDLTLDGALNISTPTEFGPGVYRIADYGGTLMDNGLDIGTTPAGSTAADFTVQTSVVGEVNLVSDVQVGIFQFWDGGAAANVANNAVDGGDGVWSVTTPNWTILNGAVNGAMNPQPGFAIFEGAPGTVTVDDTAGAVGVTGMQFAVDGYTVSGDAITLTAAPTTIRVGDGTSAGAGYTATISSALIGAGGLEKTDLGTLVLNGVNSYAGGTTVTGGTLVGSATSFGAGDIADNATLVIDQPADAAFANAINGTGAFIKQGAGSLNLTGTSALSGTTTVASGRLAVNGSLANSIVTVQSGATLGGNGAVGGVIAEAGSNVGPGNSIGLLNVNGDYSQASGAIYQVELTSAGQSDRIVATGTATLASGAILNVTKTDAAPFVLGTQYTVLTAAGGVSGSFTVTGDLSTSPFIGLVEHSDASDIYFDVAKIQSFASAGATHNQIATGGGADSLPAAGALSTALLNLPSVDAARDAFDQLSGEIGASAKTAAIEDSRFVRDAAVGRMRDGAGSSGGAAGWVQAFGSWGSTDGDGNAADLNRSVGGFLAGIDMPVWDDWRAGVLAGYSQTDFDVNQRGSSGSSDAYHVGIYGGTQSGALGVRLGAAYTWHDLSTVRSVAFQGFSDHLSANYDAGTTQLFGDVGYRIDTGSVALEPFADLAYVDLKTDGFRETGGAAALISRSNNTGVTFSTLGLRGSHDLDVNDTMFTLNGTFGWRHAFGDITPNSTVAFAGGTNFDILGVPVAKDSLAIDAGFNVTVALGVTLGLSYTGQIASHAQDNGLKGNLSWQF